MWAVLGIAALWVAMHVDYRAYRNDTFVWVLIGAVGLTLLGVLFSAPVNGTCRWLGIEALASSRPSSPRSSVCSLQR